MSLVTQLIGFGLRQVIGDSADTVIQVVEVVEQRFRDHSRTLPKALENAHDRAWQALGVALAGDSLLDRVKVFFASGDDKGVREQVELFLKGNAVSFAGTPAEFRQACLDELKRLRKSGLLSAQGGSPADIAKQAAGFARHTDPQGLIEESRRAVAGVADALAGAYPNLSRLLRTPTPAGPPLLAAAFCYFFRREVETDDELAHGLFFDGLRLLSASQAKAFGEVGKALAALGGQFDALFEQLGRIESAVVETRAVAVQTHGAVLDLQAEQQRSVGLHLANAETLRNLREQVQQLLGQVGMTRGEVRPGNSCSIRGEDERRAVKALLARFRQLPTEEQRQAPALLNGLGKLQVGTGDHAEARQTFVEVVQVVGDPSGKAEASFNAYRAALEERKWDAALAALREAGSHDPQRFAPFPLHKYEAKRILGAGGFGTAVLCRDRHFDEDVVVKTLHAADLARGVDDVFREARILRRLSHPAIIGVRDCDYADPAHKARPFLVMDYFPGGNLQQFVEQRGPLNLEQLLAVAVQVAEGMRAAQAQGVLHRDLKPANLLVRKEGNLWKVKIIDFGLALRQQTVETSKVRSGATHKSMLDSSVAGTLDYAPPEQMGKLPGVQPGPYSDIYAFARTCCYAMFQTPHPTYKHWQQCPLKLATLLDACLEEAPAQRPQDFAAVLAGLAGMGGGGGPLLLEQDLKEALEELRTRGDSRRFFERQGPTRIAEWRAAAEKGVAAAQWFLACCLFEGTGIQEDAEAALTWLRRAAEGGLPVAQTDLGNCYYPGGECYYSGEEVKEDANEAVRLYTAAAAQGLPEALVNLGDCYYEGMGVAEDLAEAARHYRKAAEANWARGQDSLGHCYLKGSGVEHDQPQAARWYRKAAEQGLASAQHNLGWCYECGKGVKKNWGEAAKWYRKAAEQGIAECQFALANCYKHGYGVEQDLAQAEHWYRKAAEQGYKKAKNALARLRGDAKPGPAPGPEDEDTNEDEGAAAKPSKRPPAARVRKLADQMLAGRSPKDLQAECRKLGLDDGGTAREVATRLAERQLGAKPDRERPERKEPKLESGPKPTP